MPEVAHQDELRSIWGPIREALAGALPASTFELWLEPLRPERLERGTLVVSAPRSTHAWVERRYGERIGSTARAVRPDVEDVAIIERGVPDTGPVAGSPESLPLAPEHSFERFVIGPGNRVAHAAALAVAELPGEAYNPLFLHGPPGLGKTHLLTAIAHYLRTRQPELAVHYTTAERFTTEFVTALRLDGPERFKQRYRSVDALLIDDVQVLEGKQRTEEEFVHTFNALHAAGKQIVLSSDRPPEALAQLAERLRDRFHWGLTVDLSPPDLRTRLALLWRMVSDLPLEVVDPGALGEIAAAVPDNVRRLEGAMTRVAAVASIMSEPVSRALVGRTLAAPGGDDTNAPTKAPTIPAIQDAVASAVDIGRDQLLSTSRTPRVAHARQLAMYLSRELTAAPVAAIARAFHRDHTTVLYAMRAVQGRLEPGSPTVEELQRARTLLGIAAPTPPPTPHDRPPTPPAPSTA